MYDPKFRFALLICMIVPFLTFCNIIYTYFFSPKRFSLDVYISGLGKVGFAVVAGFVLVWLCAKFLKIYAEHRRQQTLTGEGFNFPIRLTRFTPDVIAPPAENRDIHPLEAEIIGFLNGYRDWPMLVDRPQNERESLYTHTMARWEMMKTLAAEDDRLDIGPAHRVAALAQDLGLIYAYVQNWEHKPWHKFWEQDDIRYTQRCVPHGSLSSFVLSSFPSFAKLSHREMNPTVVQRAVLTTLKYRDMDPRHFPVNCDPLAKDIYEAIHKVEHRMTLQSEQESADITPSDAEHILFRQEILDALSAVVRGLDINPADLNEASDGVNLGKGRVVLKMGHFTKALVEALSPTVRTAYHLWDVRESRTHPAWPFIVSVLKEANVLKEQWEDVTADRGLFQLKLGQYDFSNSIILQFDKKDYPTLVNSLSSLPKWSGVVDAEQNPHLVLEHIHAKVAQMDEMLANLRS